MRSDINQRKENCKKNAWHLNNMLLNNLEITEEIKEEIKKKYIDSNDNKNTKTQNL